MSRLRLNPLTGLFDYDPVIPPDFITGVSDTATIDLTVTAGILTADLVTPLPASSISGTPNTYAYFNSLGLLDDLPNWTVQSWYGPASLLTIDTPADAGDIYPNIHSHEIEINPVLNTTQYHPRAFSIDLHVDRTGSGGSIEDATGLLLTASFEGSGTIDNFLGLNIIHSLGVGNGSTTTNGKAIDVSSSTTAGDTVVDYSQMSLFANFTAGTHTNQFSNLNLGASGEFENFSSISVGNSANIINDAQLVAANFSGNIGGNFNGFNFGNSGSITGFANFTNLTNSGPLGAGTNFINVYNSGNSTGSVFFLNYGQDGDVATNAGVLNATINGDVSNGFTGIGVFPNSNISGSLQGYILNVGSSSVITGSLTGINLNYQGSATQQVYGVSLYNQATADSFVGGVFSNVANVTEQRLGVRADLQGTSRTTTGVDVFVTGNSTDDAQGIRISIDTATSTNQRVRSLDINGHTYSMNGQFTPQSGVFVETGNNNYLELRVASGSPLTGTDTLINGNIVALLVQDNVAVGPIGVLGLPHTALINLLGVATGATISAPVHNLLIAGSVQNPGYADAGVISDYRGITIGGVLPAGGSTVVTEYRGIYMLPTFDSYAGTNWGIVVDGSSAENYLNRLAIGTASQTNASGLLLDVNGEIGITDLGSGLTIAEGANARMGVTTLVAGTSTVNTTAVATGDRIFLTRINASATIGNVSVENIVSGTSFDIVSTDGSETSDIQWIIVRPI